jgi:hypothetical protein
MAGIKIEEIKSTKISTTDGKELKPGDLILIGVKGQDVIGTYKEISATGYFVVEPLVTASKQVQYRPSSITACFKVDALELDTENDIEGAAKLAAVEADAGALAPATE